MSFVSFAALCNEKPTWKYEMWHFYSSGSLGGGLFCDTRWSCRHTSIMEETAAPVFRWKVLSSPLILCVTPFEVPVTDTSHSVITSSFLSLPFITVSSHWSYANTRRLVLPQFFSAAKVCKTVVHLTFVEHQEMSWKVLSAQYGM